VTCIAFDAAGVKVPEKILFMRKDQFANYVELKPNGNLHFVNRSTLEDGKKKLFVTMFIKNATLEDDSLFGALGRYECHAFAVGDAVKSGRHGFSVSVIKRSEIPKVVVPDVIDLEQNDDVTLTCNLTERGSPSSTPLKRISWVKDGVVLDSVRNPNPGDPRDMLSPLKIKYASIRDGGNYTCLLQVLLRNIIEYNVTASTVIRVSVFGIVEPFPENIYPIEFTSAQVTCVAFDAAGVKVPDKIVFMRRDKFNRFVELKPNGNLHFENGSTFEDSKKKLFVTMFIRNVTLDDDSLFGVLGRYECHAFAVGNDVQSERHGFSVSVITRYEIPRVVVSDIGVLQHNDDVTLICNLTERGNQASTPLKRISWLKDGVVLKSVRNPDPRDPRDTLGPLTIKDVGVRDGGNYTCLLQVLLRNIREYNVTASTVIHIAPWFEHKGEKEVVGKTGETATLECSATGFPLKVEWKSKRGVVSCNDSSEDQRYSITRKGRYDPYSMIIADLETTDSGSYYCCLPSNCSTQIDQDRCQKFALTVTVEENLENPEGGAMTLTSHGIFVVMAFFMVSSLIL